jgi:hypothetical protein
MSKYFKQFLISLLLLAGLAPLAHSKSCSFAVAGDDRTDVTTLDTSKIDPTGINTSVFKKLLSSLAVKKPAFLLYTGDLVYGENPRIRDKITDQFTAWKALLGATKPSFPVLPVRGNHELNGDPEGKIWLADFKPDLDINKVSYLSGQEGFSYLYSPPDHPEVAVVALDQFIPGRAHRVDLVGLETALKQAKINGAKHLFVFAHEMAFTCTNHPDSENMAAFPEDRNKFLELLRSYGCEYFFAGHDHAYDWMEIRHPKWPKEYHLNQIVAGTAGAPFYPDKGYFGSHDGFDLVRIDHKQNTYGYLLVTINEEAKDNENPITVSFETVTP